jgi:hypothetical protein
MGELHRTIIEIDLSEAEIVGRASSERPNDLRWTVLTVYRHEIGEQQFVAEIVGETKVEGEQRRVKRATFHTLASALNWRAFNPQSALYQELHAKILQWICGTAKKEAGLISVPFGGVAGEDSAVAHAQPLPPERDKPWDGEIGDFRGALCWLYEPLGVTLEEAITRVAKDWDRSVASVRAAINLSGTDGLPGWARTFTMQMRHFKRESFLAAEHG